MAKDSGGLTLGGIFSIGSDSSTATTAKTTPGGELEFKTGYNIKVTVGYSFTENTGNKDANLMVMLDNNTSGSTNSINATFITKKSFAKDATAETGTFELLIDCSKATDNDTGHFIAVRRESAVTATITSIKIEYVAKE